MPRRSTRRGAQTGLILPGTVGPTELTPSLLAEVRSTAFPDSTFRVQDNTDPTKQIALEASAITTGTTRTLSVPDAAGAIVVDRDSGYVPVAGKIVVPKTAGHGLMIDTAAPVYGWVDMLGWIRPKTSGANTPTLATLRGGNCQSWAFTANDVCDVDFHLPHDYVPGTDLYIHWHWSHNGTAISGSFVVDYWLTYAKGHNQAIFPAEVAGQITVSTPNIATIPRWIHRIDEIAISSNGGSASTLDRNALEPDGLIICRFKTTTIPTITGGSPNNPFVIFCDIHYQSTGIPTKNRAPNFYT